MQAQDFSTRLYTHSVLQPHKIMNQPGIMPRLHVITFGTGEGGSLGKTNWWAGRNFIFGISNFGATEWFFFFQKKRLARHIPVGTSRSSQQGTCRVSYPDTTEGTAARKMQGEVLIGGSGPDGAVLGTIAEPVCARSVALHSSGQWSTSSCAHLHSNSPERVHESESPQALFVPVIKVHAWQSALYIPVTKCSSYASVWMQHESFYSQHVQSQARFRSGALRRPSMPDMYSSRGFRSTLSTDIHAL